MQIIASFCLLALVGGILALSGASWTFAITRFLTLRQSGEAPTPHTRSPSRWGAVDLVLNAIVFVLISVAAAAVVRMALPAEQIASGVEVAKAAAPKPVLFLVMGFAQLIAIAIGTVLLRLRAGAEAVRAVWSLREFVPDLILALYAFGLVIVPVFLIQAGLSQIITYEHPAITPFRESKDWMFFACAAFSAVICAPLGEEYFFRGLLQGWLERFAILGASNWEELFAPKVHRDGIVQAQNVVVNAPDVVAPELVSNPYAFPPDGHSNAPQTAVKDFDHRAVVIPHWPLWVTSGIFALMHISQGAAPIPLFFFSVAVGYVYRRTGRIFPCWVMHVLLNGFSMTMLGLSTFLPMPK